MESLINISKENLWKSIWSFDHINKEIAPLFRMTSPSIDLDTIDPKSIPLNQQLFKSYIFLFKIIPIDIHSFMLKSIIEFEFFEETSSSLMMKHWNHTRALKARGPQTLLIDKIEYQHRLGFMGQICFPIYKFVFAHRHKKLRSFYN